MKCNHEGVRLDLKTGDVLLEVQNITTGEICETIIYYCPYCGRDMLRIKQKELQRELQQMYTLQTRLNTDSGEYIKLVQAIEKYQVIHEKLGDIRKKLKK